MDEEEPVWSSSISRNKERSIATQFTRSSLYARSRSIRAIPYNPVHITRLLSSVFIPISRMTLCTPKRYFYFYVARRIMKVASQNYTRGSRTNFSWRLSEREFDGITNAAVIFHWFAIISNFLNLRARASEEEESARNGPEADQRQRETKWRT